VLRVKWGEISGSKGIGNPRLKSRNQETKGPYNFAKTGISFWALRTEELWSAGFAANISGLQGPSLTTSES